MRCLPVFGREGVVSAQEVARARGRRVKRQQRREANAARRRNGKLHLLPKSLRRGTAEGEQQHSDDGSDDGDGSGCKDIIVEEESEEEEDDDEEEECSVAAGFIGTKIMQTFVGYDGEYEGEVIAHSGIGDATIFTIKFLEDGDIQRYSMAQLRQCMA